jgi:hypothetical protein
MRSKKVDSNKFNYFSQIRFRTRVTSEALDLNLDARERLNGPYVDYILFRLIGDLTSSRCMIHINFQPFNKDSF